MPSRYLRPEIRTSRRWNDCSWCGQSFFIRLLTLVDDYGRYEADPVILCSEAFPTFRHFRPGKVTKLLAELHAKGLIQLYQHDGKTYLQITRWKERIRSTQSKFPAPPGVQNEQSATEKPCKHSTSQTSLLTNAATASALLPPQPTPNALALQPKPIYKEKDGSEGGAASNSSNPARKCTAGPKRLHGIPASVGEVIAYGQSLHPKISEEQCRAFWAHYEGQARTNDNGDIFWVTSGDAIVTNWKVKLPQFRTLHDPHRTPDQRGVAQRPNRNIGTANEGESIKYRGLGRVAGSENVQ